MGAQLNYVWNAKSGTKVFDTDLKRLYQDLDTRDYLGIGPYLIEGLDLSTSGLNITISEGSARGDNCFVPFLNNNSGSTISTPCHVSTSTTITIPPMSAGFLVLDYDLLSSNPSDNYFTPTTSPKFVLSRTTVFPTGSVCAQLLLAKVSSSPTTVSLTIDSDCIQPLANTLLKVSTPLSSFIVSTTEGYPDNGVFIVRTFAIPGEAGLLLGDSGVSYILPSPFLSPDLPYYRNLDFFDITAGNVPALYPDTGIFITRKSPLKGFSGILIGDSGSNYILTVDTVNLPATTQSLGLKDILSTGISAAIGGVTSGIQITNDPRTTGTSSLILGTDGNAYTQVI